MEEGEHHQDQEEEGEQQDNEQGPDSEREERVGAITNHLSLMTTVMVTISLWLVPPGASQLLLKSRLGVHSSPDRFSFLPDFPALICRLIFPASTCPALNLSCSALPRCSDFVSGLLLSLPGPCRIKGCPVTLLRVISCLQALATDCLLCRSVSGFTMLDHLENLSHLSELDFGFF